jgi:hypothetical protein
MAEQTESAERRLPSLDDVRHWVGLRIDGLGSRTLGRIAGDPLRHQVAPDGS